MAEMLVRLIDKTGKDVATDALLTKRGDVITIQPDGWPWSNEERNGGQWMVVQVPGATVADVSAFLATDDGDPVLHYLPRKRASCIDMTQLLALGATKPTKSQILALKIIKPRLSDPSVIGQSSSLIG